MESEFGYVVPPAQKWIQLALLYGLGKAFHLKRRRGPSQVSLWCRQGNIEVRNIDVKYRISNSHCIAILKYRYKKEKKKSSLLPS